MRRFYALFLSLVLLISGCSATPQQTESITNTDISNDVIGDSSDVDTASQLTELTDDYSTSQGIIEQSFEEDTSTLSEIVDIQYLEDNPEEIIEGDSKCEQEEPEFSSLNDPELRDYIERDVFLNLSTQLGSDYSVENVSSIYVSKEYIEELAYNSKTNVFFGYTLAELNEQFQDTPYVFTLDEHNHTTVVPMGEYDDTYERVLKNVAIGTGVILMSVTISAVSGGVGAPAISMIFAASAKTGTIFALSAGTIATTMKGITKYIETGNLEAAIKDGVLFGSEGFKWGAISGAVIGAGYELVTLKAAAQGGLTLNEVATILKENKLPANFLKQIHSMDEYRELVELASQSGITIGDISNICMKTGYPLEVVKLFKSVDESMIYFEQAGLYAQTINGKLSLIRAIDLSYESELAGQIVTNLERMKLGYAAIDPITGQPYQLHHIGQSISSPLAILTPYEHSGGGNYAILHNVGIEAGQGVHSTISPSEWAAQKKEFWKAVAELLSQQI